MAVRRGVIAATMVAAIFGSGMPAVACAVCVGDPSSPLTWGTNRGIVFLIGTVALVYAGIVAFVIATRRRRADRLDAEVGADNLAMHAAVTAKGVRG